MGRAACALEQARQIFGAADLHHPLHRLKVNAEIQGAGAHHPADVSSLHSRFDRFAFAAVDGAVVQRQGPIHLWAGETQALIPTLRLVAGVGEQQRADGGMHRPHQLFVHAQAQMACPGEAVDAAWQQAADLGAAARGAAND